jgi:methionine-rich copper-binding protein CopC
MKKTTLKKNKKDYKLLNFLISQNRGRNFYQFLFIFSVLTLITPETQAQEVALTGVDAFAPNEIQFVLLRNFNAGEVIYFTEAIYSDTSNQFDSTEGHMAFTIPAGGLVENKVITIEESSSDTFTVTFGTGSAILVPGSGSWSISNTDTMYAYSASNSSTPWSSITEIHSYLNTSNNTIPADVDPVNDYPNVVKILLGVGAGRPLTGSFKDGNRINTTKAAIEDKTNWNVDFNQNTTMVNTDFTNQLIVSNTDTTPPTLTSSSPTDNATGIATNSNIVLTFNENIAFGTGNIQVIDITDGTNSFTIDAAAPGVQASINNNILTINPNSGLDDSSNYAIQIAATAIDDTSANSFAGITNNTTLDFTTADETNPTFDSANSTPIDDATGVSTTDNIVVDFSENIVKGTGLITLYNVTGSTSYETYDIATATATTSPADGALGIVNDKLYINPTPAMFESNVYAIQIAATAIDDTAGNSFAGIIDTTTFNFTTADETNPVLSSSLPTDNATTVTLSQEIELTFNENIYKGTGNIFIKKTSDNSTIETIDVTTASVTITTAEATINPTSDFDLNTEYYVQIDNTAFKDAANNNYAGISSTTALSFTTEANQTNTYISAGGDWSDTSRWSLGRIPISTDNVVIPNSPDLDISSVTINNLNISGSLNIETGNSLTVNGNLTQNGTFNINSDATTNGSLIVKGTATGNVTYLRFVTANADISKDWYLISSPVNGHNIAGFLPSMAKNGTKRGIAPYINTNGVNAKWAYYSEDDTPGAFTNGKGYTLKLDHALIPNGIALDFVGTLNTDNAGVAISVNATGDQFNVIGNPYTSYIDGAAFLDNVDAGRLTEKTIWLWNVEANNNEGEYITKNSANAYKIAPGQGFFVQALATGDVNFLEAMQTHSGGDTFLKQQNRPEIKLSITDGTNIKSAEIFYIENKTTGFDDGYDSSMFTGASNTFAVYTQLVLDNEGKNLAIQTLPNSNYEDMVVPVGVNTAADAEITFSLNASNFSSDLKIFLEDKATNTVTRLDEANSNYKITLSENLNGIGRFYLHTSASNVLSVDENLLENVTIYKRDHSTLRIVGLSAENIAVKLYTVLGKQVMSSSFKSNGVSDISLPKLASGVYIVQLQTDFGKLNKKIIIE